jgi:hypothetical protein
VAEGGQLLPPLHERDGELALRVCGRALSYGELRGAAGAVASPYSTKGALVLANAKGVDQDRFYKQLLVYGAIVVAVAPLALWLALVVIGG